MEKSIAWLEKLLTLQGLTAAVSGHQRSEASADSAENSDRTDDSFWLTIDTASLSEEQVQSLIGDRGQVLDAIQYLANTTLNMAQAEDDQRAYTIEINGYREQRQAELKGMVEAAAEQVLADGEEHELKGLSAAERRYVHGLFSEYEQLKTFSQGREPERHLVVTLIGDNDDTGTDTDTNADTETDTSADTDTDTGTSADIDQ